MLSHEDIPQTATWQTIRKKTDSQRGVVISEQPFDDIAFFHLKKNTPSNVEYIGINFEEHPAFIKGIENCECMFIAVSNVKKPWLLMLEMKYCEEDNIEGYAYKAYSQMKATLDKVDNLQLTDSSKFNRYFVYSVPEHEDRSPFGAFTLSQNETLRTAHIRKGWHPTSWQQQNVDCHPLISSGTS